MSSKFHRIFLRLSKLLFHIILIFLLTVLTQIGGILYLLVLVVIKKNKIGRRKKRIAFFTFVYLICTFLLIPIIAPLFGREKIQETEFLRAHSFLYKLANRNYVRPELNSALDKIAAEFEKSNSGIRLEYLDANFPFLDGFPLLPHLSHSDGKKIDVSLIYQTRDGKLTNEKPSVSGYGVYEGPRNGEHDQISICKQRGNWQYDFPKYVTFGKINRGIQFSKLATRQLIQIIISQGSVGKVFIEPHLKSRMGLSNKKIRYHGCQAVRHDDHIHFQLK